MQLLKQYRESRKLSQVDLAKLLGISQATLSDYENGKKRPRPSKAKQIAKVTGLSRDYLIFGE